MTDRYKTRTFAPLDRIKVIEACETSIIKTGLWLNKRYEDKREKLIERAMNKKWFPAKTREKALKVIKNWDSEDWGMSLSFYKPENWLEDRTKVRQQILALAKASKAKTINVTAKDFAEFSKHYKD